MDISTIGIARGIFDILVPGVFLLLNLGLVVYSLPFVDQQTKDFMNATAGNSAVILVIALCFGYLIGVLLRLFRTEVADHCSVAWLRLVHPDARKKRNELWWAREKFPYICWIGEVCKHYLSAGHSESAEPPEPSEIQRFYKEIWYPRRRDGQNRQFFNFCKVMINSVDERAASEINAAEALSRYIASMFCALVLSSILISITVILRCYHFGQITVGLVALLFAYLFAVLVILTYFRFVRIREVEIVFAASFRNKSIFDTLSPDSDRRDPWRAILSALSRAIKCLLK